MSLSILGLAEVVSKLTSIEARLDEKTQAAMDRVAPKVKSMAKSLAAVDTGLMRDSTDTRDLPDGPGFDLFCDVDYAVYVELGHHTRSGSFVAARPFLEPTIPYGRGLIMLELPHIVLDIGTNF
jgi:hypothetical protein